MVDQCIDREIDPAKWRTQVVRFSITSSNGRLLGILQGFSPESSCYCSVFKSRIRLSGGWYLSFSLAFGLVGWLANSFKRGWNHQPVVDCDLQSSSLLSEGDEIRLEFRGANWTIDQKQPGRGVVQVFVCGGGRRSFFSRVACGGSSK